MMHADTKAALLAAIRAELQADPTQRGYDGKNAGQIVALLNAPITVVAPPAYRDVLVSDVEGYLEGQLAMQSLIDWSDAQQSDSQALAIAKTLRRVMAGGRLTYFLTKNPVTRANVLGMFQVLAQTEGTGITQAHADALAAMTLEPAGSTATEPCRWLAVIDGISAAETPPPVKNEDGSVTFHPGYAGPPNAADEALIQEALDA